MPEKAHVRPRRLAAAGSRTYPQYRARARVISLLETVFKEEFERLAKLDEEWRDFMAQNSSYSSRSQEDEERRQYFFDSIVGNETLQQHLLEQVGSSDLQPGDRKIAELLIGNIDDLGFLQATVEETAQNTGIPREELQRVLPPFKA